MKKTTKTRSFDLTTFSCIPTWFRPRRKHQEVRPLSSLNSKKTIFWWPGWLEWPEWAVWPEWPEWLEIPEWLRLWGSPKWPEIWDVGSEVICNSNHLYIVFATDSAHAPFSLFIMMEKTRKNSQMAVYCSVPQTNRVVNTCLLIYVYTDCCKRF